MTNKEKQVESSFCFFFLMNEIYFWATNFGQHVKLLQTVAKKKSEYISQIVFQEKAGVAISQILNRLQA